MGDLFIIAAGNGSRMGGNVPKALVPITDIPNLTTSLQQIGSKFKNVYVVTNKSIQNQWEKYFEELDPELSKNGYNVVIESGLGDGHAVLQALNAVGDCSDDITICWGDVFIQYSEIVDELLSKPIEEINSGLIPAIHEDSPYVTLLTDNHLYCVSADFSKYGESHPNGFHDQSIFRFNKKVLLTSLNNLHRSFWKNGRYISPGGELSLLYVFHYLYNSNNPAEVYETQYPTMSFNTPQEVAEIQERINQQWKKEK